MTFFCLRTLMFDYKVLEEDPEIGLDLEAYLLQNSIFYEIGYNNRPNDTLHGSLCSNFYDIHDKMQFVGENCQTGAERE